MAGDLLREERGREPTEGDGGLDEVGGGVGIAHGVLEGVEPLGLGRRSPLGAVLPHFVTHVEVKWYRILPVHAFSGLFRLKIVENVNLGIWQIVVSDWSISVLMHPAR